MRGTKLSIGLRATLAIFALALVAAGTQAVAQQETVLHSFNSNGTDGVQPYGGLISDASGNLYGTTYIGGAYGYGTVFELSPSSGGWTETILYSFNNNGVDGTNPYYASLIFDASGNLYGTTIFGGTNVCPYGAFPGCGTVFELTPAGNGSWKETVLHNFENTSTDGFFPEFTLVFDKAGNLYGANGGGQGVVYKLTP